MMSKSIPLPFRRLPTLLPLAVFAVLLYCTSATAQENIQLEVVVREIVADNSGQGLDSRLGDIGKDLKKMSYSTFRLEQTHNHRVQGAHEVKVALLGKNALLIVPSGEEDGKLRFKVKLTPGDKKQRSFESTLRIPDGGTFMIGGPAYGEGVLILALTARK
jgi:hypothetical protein